MMIPSVDRYLSDTITKLGKLYPTDSFASDDVGLHHSVLCNNKQSTTRSKNDESDGLTNNESDAFWQKVYADVECI